jgi:hypothetical protein
VEIEQWLRSPGLESYELRKGMKRSIFAKPHVSWTYYALAAKSIGNYADEI